MFSTDEHLWSQIFRCHSDESDPVPENCALSASTIPSPQARRNTGEDLRTVIIRTIAASRAHRTAPAHVTSGRRKDGKAPRIRDVPERRLLRMI